MTAWMEKEYKVGDGHEIGSFLTICPAPDFPTAGVLLYTEGEKQEKYFGKVYLQLDVATMRKLGIAILECCEDVEAEANDRK